ncbi:MAG: cytochrome C [Cyanobacteria bacterium CRU_2_1]|nr:cytochrome C [Cyanobacteria bacterium CRU_2_1]
MILGLGLAQAITPAERSIAQSTVSTGTVDVVPAEYQLGQELYLENCATCHVGIPPALMPTDSWREILTESAHYGAEITPIFEPAIQIVWNYVSLYSRPLKADESIPFRLRSSRYFKALHPRVEFAEPVNVRSCATCHPGAEQFDYRSLAPEWEDAP